MTFDDFLAQLQTACAANGLVRLTFTNPSRAESNAPKMPQRASVRPVQIRGEVRYQWALRIGPQEFHENQTLPELLERTRNWCGASFRQVRLETTTAICEGRFPENRRADLATIRSGFRGQIVPRAQAAPDIRHNAPKNHLIPEGVPCPFLEQLGIMTATGQVRAAMQHKFRQINRFLEFIEEIYSELPAEGLLRVMDFGCGKSYLTFALHHLLSVRHGRAVAIVGWDRNPDLIAQCSALATSLELPGLTFARQDIAQPDPVADSPNNALHLAVSLHACDTATDAALRWAVERQAQVILSAPCCQHELAPQLSSKPLQALLRHGILRERFAAMASDTLRALALEAAGYRTTVMEFVDLEHTAKNLLLRAIRRPSGTELEHVALEEFRQWKTFLGITTFAGDAIAPVASTS